MPKHDLLYLFYLFVFISNFRIFCGCNCTVFVYYELITNKEGDKMTTLSFISNESLAEFMAKPQDLSYVTGKAYEQLGEFKIDVIFDGITKPSELDNSIYPFGRVVKEFDNEGNLVSQH